MALVMRSLFGLSCIDEAMPDASDPECGAALISAEVLLQAMEKSPAPALTQEQTYDHAPTPEHELDAVPPAPGPRW